MNVIISLTVDLFLEKKYGIFLRNFSTIVFYFELVNGAYNRIKDGYTVTQGSIIYLIYQYFAIIIRIAMAVAKKSKVESITTSRLFYFISIIKLFVNTLITWFYKLFNK